MREMVSQLLCQRWGNSAFAVADTPNVLWGAADSASDLGVFDPLIFHPRIEQGLGLIHAH